MSEANYKESTVTGSKWQRLLRVIGENPSPLVNPGATPSLLIVEEEVVSLGDSYITKPVDNIYVSFNPEDPDHQELYGALDRIYKKERDKRDLLREEAELGENGN